MQRINNILLLGLLIFAASNCGPDDNGLPPIDASPRPIADFEVSETTIRPNGLIQLSNTSTNGTSFLWDLPGATPESSTEVDPQITYTAVGRYTISLTATNENGSNTKVKENIINVVDP